MFFSVSTIKFGSNEYTFNTLYHYVTYTVNENENTLPKGMVQC